ncbi:hypothetical protein DPM19_14585 [Actinomadura craniellae]|uniref:Uncharacterized protein n=1 Tax=Actinomadura craniellae TaxID=2231787 RepID=A0A365H529_9ACTN|nr:hypothetical protein [Actinomadura craniellae]RAY14207.1 hypothetical protein DPM19_14585 [Actinomadura craniellae]
MTHGAIDPDAIPIPKVNPGEVRARAKALKTDGARIADTGHDIHAAWQGLKAFYNAPEEGLLFAATKPVAAAGEDVRRAATAAGGALVEFAEQAEYNLQRFHNLKRSATAFRAKIAGNDNWREDADLAEENDGLVRAVAHTVLSHKEDEAACANKISALVGGTRFTYTDPRTKLDGIRTPWGNATGQDKPWWQDVGDGLTDFIGGIFTDAGAMLGLNNSEGMMTGFNSFGDWWNNITDAWGGVITGIGGLTGFHGEYGWGWQGLDTAGSNWKELAHAMVPWREWDDRPGYVVTTGLLSVAGMAAGGASGIKALLNLRKTRGDHAPEPEPPDDLFDGDPAGSPDRPPTLAELQRRFEEIVDELDDEHGFEDQFLHLDRQLADLYEPAREPALVGGGRPDPHASHDPPPGNGGDSPLPPGPGPEDRLPGGGSHDDNGPDVFEEPREDLPQHDGLDERALADLRSVEQDTQRIAERYGVHVDFTTRPIDPANAVGFHRAIQRVAADYPSIFRDMQTIRIQNLDEMRTIDPSSGPNVMGFSINDRQGPAPQGIYLNQGNFTNKATTDFVALDRAMEGWSVPGSLTAKGTIYHEFGHQIGHRILTNPSLTKELAFEFKKIGISVDEHSLSAGIPKGIKSLAEGLGAYGKKNPSEMLAEGFAEWLLSPSPRPIASTIGEFIDKHFKGK